MTEQIKQRLKRYINIRIEVIHNNGQKQVMVLEKVHRTNLLLIWLDLLHLKNKGKIKDFMIYDDIEGGDIRTKRITEFIR